MGRLKAADVSTEFWLMHPAGDQLAKASLTFGNMIVAIAVKSVTGIR
jgi:hypothetical protein